MKHKRPKQSRASAKSAGPIDLRERLRGVTLALRADRQDAVKARRGSYRAANNPRSRVQTPYGGTGDQHADTWSRLLARELSRDLDRNADTFRVLMNSLCDTYVGEGVRVRPTTSDKEWNVAVAKIMHREFSLVGGGMDSRQMESWYQLQRRLVRAVFVDGEHAVLRLGNGRLQMVESEQIAGAWSHDEVYGIKLNEAGAAVSYKICPFNLTGGVDANAGSEVGASLVDFIAMRDRVSQTRGMPLLVAALDEWERIDSYRESEIIAAEQGSQIYGAIKRQPGDFGYSQAGSDGSAPITTGVGDDGAVDWRPTVSGSLLDLPNGADYVPINPQRPNKDTAPFLIELLRHFCAVGGLAYEFSFNDLRGLSWSVNRAMVQMARDTIRIRQVQQFGPALSSIYRWKLARLIESGVIPSPPPDWDQHEHQWPVISWPDEGKEYEAQALGLTKGLTSRHRIHGPQWRDLMDERAAELAYASELAREHNGKFDEFKVSPFFFLGSDPDGAGAQEEPGGQLSEAQIAQRKQSTERSAENRKKPTDQE